MDGREKAERGQILVLFALMMAVLAAMAGVGIDLTHVRAAAEEVQRAADAAALAGDAYLTDLSQHEQAQCPVTVPSPPLTTNQSFFIAAHNACIVAATNGYWPGGPNGTAIQVSAPSGVQLAVTISTGVDTPFLHLAGRGRITVTRSATAVYEDPILMGAPDHMLGFAPIPTDSFDDLASCSDACNNQLVGGQYFPC